MWNLFKVRKQERRKSKKQIEGCLLQHHIFHLLPYNILWVQAESPFCIKFLAIMNYDLLLFTKHLNCVNSIIFGKNVIALTILKETQVSRLIRSNQHVQFFQIIYENYFNFFRLYICYIQACLLLWLQHAL